MCAWVNELDPILLLWHDAVASLLTHWGRGKIAKIAISQTTFLNAFSWIKMHKFRLGLYRNLIIRFELTIFQHWFRWWFGTDQATGHYLDQWLFVYGRIWVARPQWVISNIGHRVIVCSGNDLASSTRQANTRTTHDFLSTGHSGTNFKEIWIKCQILLHKTSILRMPPVKYRLSIMDDAIASVSCQRIGDLHAILFRSLCDN